MPSRTKTVRSLASLADAIEMFGAEFDYLCAGSTYRVVRNRDGYWLNVESSAGEQSGMPFGCIAAMCMTLRNLQAEADAAVRGTKRARTKA